MLSCGIYYQFISPDFDNMVGLKAILERKHSTLQCDIALNYNPQCDLTRYSLLVIDIFSISNHPLELLSSLRHATYIPIAVLVPQAEIDAARVVESLQGTLFKQLYDIGADAVLPLDFEDTVAAYCGAFYRRHVYFQHQEPISHRSTMIFRDELVIEPKQRRVTMQGRDVELTHREFELLNYLACNADIVITHELIADRIWGSDEIINGSIFSAINRLRQKIEPDPRNPTYITSIYGGGYKFKSYIDEAG